MTEVETIRLVLTFIGIVVVWIVYVDAQRRRQQLRVERLQSVDIEEQGVDEPFEVCSAETNLAEESVFNSDPSVEKEIPQDTGTLQEITDEEEPSIKIVSDTTSDSTNQKNEPLNKPRFLSVKRSPAQPIKPIVFDTPIIDENNDLAVTHQRLQDVASLAAVDLNAKRVEAPETSTVSPSFQSEEDIQEKMTVQSTAEEKLPANIKEPAVVPEEPKPAKEEAKEELKDEVKEESLEDVSPITVLEKEIGDGQSLPSHEPDESKILLNDTAQISEPVDQVVIQPSEVLSAKEAEQVSVVDPSKVELVEEESPVVQVVEMPVEETEQMSEVTVTPSLSEENADASNNTTLDSELDEIIQNLEAKELPEDSDLITVNIFAHRKKQFGGYELLQAIQANGFYYGDMQIFHHYGDDFTLSKKLFSLASATEPGDFDLNNMGSFVSNGLILFMNIKEHNNPIEVFDRMIEVARQLADDIAGLLVIDNTKPLNDENIEQTRARITKLMKH